MDTIHTIERLDQIDSTSSHLKRTRQTIQSGHLCVAHTQTAGRGRRSNVWLSAPGKNLTFSFLLDTSAEGPYDALMVSALALLEVLASYGITGRIKMPNDLYVGAQKIGGLLIEKTKNDTHEHTVIGIGLNVNEQLRPAMRPTAISMAMITKSEYELDDVLQAFIDRFNALVHQPVFERFRQHVLKQGQRVTWNEQDVAFVDFNKMFVCEIKVNEQRLNVPCDQLTFQLKKYKL